MGDNGVMRIGPYDIAPHVHEGLGIDWLGHWLIVAQLFMDYPPTPNAFVSNASQKTG